MKIMNKHILIAFLLLFCSLFSSVFNQSCRLPGMRRTNLADNNMNALGTGRLKPLSITWVEGEGAVWFNRKVLVHPRLEIGMRVEINELGCGDAGSWAIDGFTMILSKTNNYMNGIGAMLGYYNIYDAIVTEIDLWANWDYGDSAVNSVSIHKCFKSNCSYLENGSTIQRTLPITYDVCKKMVYDIVLIYNNGNFRIQWGDTYLVDTNENLGDRFDNWAYVGFSGFFRGKRREFQMAGSYICEDDYIMTDFTNQWLVNSQWVVQNTIDIPLGSLATFGITLKDVTGLAVPHAVGLGMWNWSVSVGVTCGAISAFSITDNYRLNARITNCFTAGQQKIIFATEKGSAPTVYFNVIAKVFEKLRFAGYNAVQATEDTACKLASDGFYYFGWGSLQGEFSIDDFSTTKGINFIVESTDLYDNAFLLGTDVAVVTPQLGFTASNPISSINPVISVVSNGRYNVFVPVTIAGSYSILSKFLNVSKTGNRFKFNVNPGRPTTVKSVCSLTGYGSTPYLGSGVTVSIKCSLFDQGGNLVAVQKSESQYGMKYGCRLDRLSYDNRSSSLDIGGVSTVDSFSCSAVTDLNGKFSFQPYYKDKQGVITNISVQLNTFYVQPNPTDISVIKVYDYGTNQFSALTNKSVNISFISSASSLTLIEFFDKDNTPYSAIDYPATFDKSTLNGSIWNVHDTTNKATVRFDYTSLLNKKYVGVYIDDKTFIKKSSHLFQLDITLNGVVVTINLVFPLGNTNGKQVCIHPLSLPATQFLPTSTTGSLTTNVNSDVTVGQIMLATTDNFLYNYRYDIKGFVVTVTPADANTNVYITENSNVEGFYNIRMFSTKANSYKVSLSISNVAVLTGYQVSVVPLPYIMNLEASNLNTYNTALSTEFDKYMLNIETNDNKPNLYFNALDDFKNYLNMVPDKTNSFLGAKVTLTINGAVLDVTYDDQTVSLSYNATKNAYLLVDNLKIVGDYVLTITSQLKKTLIYRYTKNPGKVSSPTSSATLVSNKNLKINETATVLVSLKDAFSVNVAVVEAMGKAAASNLKVTAKAADSSVINFSFVEIYQLTLKFTTAAILKQSTFSVTISYTDPVTRLPVTIACTDCIFYVNYDQFDITKCKLNAVLSKTIEMSQISNLQVNNQVDKPLFNFNFYDTNSNLLLYVDQASQLRATFTGENLNLALVLEWIGTSQIMWTFPADIDLKDIKGANYILAIYYNEVISQKYTIQFLGDGVDSDAGNGLPSYDLTFFSATDIRPTAGINLTFNIEFRTAQNLRVNSYGDLNKFSFANSKYLPVDKFKASVQFGAKKGDYIITVNSILSSTSTSPIVLTITYNGYRLKQTVNIIVKCGELTKLVIDPSSKYDATKFLLKNIKATDTSIIIFRAYDKYDNNFDDLYDSTIFSMDRIVRLFNLQHSNNSPFITSVTTDPTKNIFNLMITNRQIGTVAVSSSIMTEAWKYEVLPGPLTADYTYGSVTANANFIAGDVVSFKIFPKDQYNNVIITSLLSVTDLGLIAFNVVQPRGVNTVVDKATKSKVDSDNSVEYKVALLEAGNNNFKALVGSKEVSCLSCQMKVNLSPVVFLKSRFYQGANELSTTVTFNLDKGNLPTFTLNLYDKYANLYPFIPADFQVTPTFLGNDAIINLCTESVNGQVNVSLCQDLVNRKNWLYLVSKDGYSVTLQNNADSLVYKINLIGGASDADASNGPLDVSKTFFSTTKVSIIAGQFATFMIELRTTDGMRKNYWYDTPNDLIKLAFSQQAPAGTYTSDVTIAAKPGQYNVKISSTKTFSANDNNIISVSIEGIKCALTSVQLTVLPDVPVSAVFVAKTGEEIPRTSLPTGNADVDYVLLVKLSDKFKNVADVETKDFNYSISPPDTKASIQITSQIIKNTDKTFSITVNTIYSGNYSINSILLGDKYPFVITPGAPSAINSLIIAPAKETAGNNVVIFIVPFDGDNNYIDPRTVGMNNGFNLTYKYKDRLTDSYVSYLPLTEFSIQPVTADIGCKDCYGYAYPLQLKFRNQNYFRATLGVSAEIKCSNCVTNVDPGVIVFAQSSFKHYDTTAGKFVDLEDNANEDNAKTDIIYRIYPRDAFLNKIDTVTDVAKYSVVLIDKDNDTYTLKNQSPTTSPQEYIEFVKNDDKAINKDLSYNTLTGGFYKATFSNGTEKLVKTIVLIGRAGDDVASNTDIEEQNTVINEAKLSFTAGQTGYVIIELRTVNNLRKNNWNQDVVVKHQIVDKDGQVVTGMEDKSFTSSVRPAGVLGVFYSTVSSTLSAATLNDKKLVLQIIVNGKIVTKLTPQVQVGSSVMKRAEIMSLYFKEGSTTQLKDGDADTVRFFKVAAFDVYNNPTVCDPLALKLSAMGPDNHSLAITAGREVTTGFATYVIENKIAGDYTIDSDSGLLSKYSFKNKNGKMVPENSYIVNNDRTIIAGNKASVNITPKDKYKNLVPPIDVVFEFHLEILTPSGKKITCDVTTVGSDIVFSKQLTEKGVNNWKITISSQNIVCESCVTSISPNVPVTANSVLSTENAGGVLTNFSNNSELPRNNKDPLRVYVALFDTYANLIDTIPNDVSVKTPIMSGKSMKQIVFDVNKNSNNNLFKLTVPLNQVTAFNHLVSGQYNFSYTVERSGDSSFFFTYKINLLSDTSDAAYGNGDYVVEQTEVSNSSLILYADTTFTINMKLKTAERLYYNYDIDLENDVKYAVSPADSSFKFKIYKKGLNYADYNIDVSSSISQPDTQLKLTIQIKDPLNPNIFKAIPTVISINIKPKLPPSSEKTVVVSKPGDVIKNNESISITFKLFDDFGNLYIRNTDLIDNNNLVVTNNNVQVTNSAIQLRSDGYTYEVSFVPSYPPRTCEVNIYYKDSKQQVNILPSPIVTKVISEAYYPNTLVSSNNLNEMNAGGKLELSVTFYDQKNVCIDNIDNIPVFASVTGPLEQDDSKRINYQYKFKLATRESSQSSACVKSFEVDVPDTQVYNVIGTYKGIVKVGENGYEAKVFSQKLVPDVLDITKFVSTFTMDGEFNPGRVLAGTELKFTIQGNDRFFNPIRTILNPDISLKIVTKTGKIAISNKDNPDKFDYEILLVENVTGVITGLLKIYTTDSYLIQYFYKNISLKSIDTIRGPFEITIVPQPCSAAVPGINIDSMNKATTGTPTFFDIKCKDLYQNVITNGGELFKIMLTVNVEESKTSTDVKTKLTDNSDGSYRVDFVPPLTGSYNLVVDLRGEIYYSYRFAIKDSACPDETPHRCPNDSEKCVANLIDCIPNRNNCPEETPFYCKVEDKDTCVKSQIDCDCPTDMIKCDYPKICVPKDKDYMCPFSLPITCSSLFLNASVLCSDGICRSSLDDAPAQRVCPIGFVMCSDLTCREDYGKCASYDDCPKNNMIRCADQSCVLDQKDCPSMVTCPKPGMYFCPDGTCVTSEVICRPLPKCISPNVVLCADNSCVADIKNCPKQVACGHQYSLCQDIICKTTCLK